LLGKDIGFEMIDAGKINIARLLEPVAMLWIRLALDGISHSSFSAANVLALVPVSETL